MKLVQTNTDTCPEHCFKTCERTLLGKLNFPPGKTYFPPTKEQLKRTFPFAPDSWVEPKIEAQPTQTAEETEYTHIPDDLD